MTVTGYTQAGADAKLALKADTASLATVASTGSYGDLANKPTIPAAQVQTDWNATTGMGSILNKPTLGTAAAQDVSEFATAAQGTKADAAIPAPGAPADGQVLAYDASSSAWAGAALTFNDIAGTGTLAQLAPGSRFTVIYNGTAWTYAGATITSRPTPRTDVFMDAVDYTGTTAGTGPSFAIAGDSYDVKS